MPKRGASPEWITPVEFQDLAKASATPASIRGLALRKQFIPEIDTKGIDDVQRTIPFRITTGTRDRDRDTISPQGWQVENYRKNPVVLWSHDYSSLPVAKAVTIETRPDALASVAQFVSRDVYPFADTVYQMVKGGFLNATSVGFRPLAWVFNEEERGVDFSKQELLEYSIVPVPANAEALIEARSAGIDLGPLREWAEKRLDEWLKEDGLWVPKSLVEAVYRYAGSSKSVSVGTEPIEKPYPNEHACRLRNPDDFQDNSFRRTEREHEGKKYAVLMGRLKGEDTMTEQAYRYPKDGWSVSDARSHCRSHHGMQFEPASGETEAHHVEMYDYLCDSCWEEIVQSEKGVSPRDVSTELAPEGEAWSAPSLQDLTDQSWDDLSQTAKRKIAGYFAWAASMPPETFGDLKLPHHNKSGQVVWRGVASAAARLNQSSIPSADVGAVRGHLARHYRAFDKTPPWEAENVPAPLTKMPAGMGEQMDQCMGEMDMARQHVEKAKSRMEGMRGMMETQQESVILETSDITVQCTEDRTIELTPAPAEEDATVEVITPETPVFDISPEQITQAVREVVGSVLEESISRHVTAAINRARGRVD